MRISASHHLEKLIERYPELQRSRSSIWDAFQAMKESFGTGGKLLVCGNGGSAADAEHIVGELMKGFLLRRSVGAVWTEKLQEVHSALGWDLAEKLQLGLPAIALNAHTALSTAVANDIGGEMVFAQQVFALGSVGDVLLGISTSGGSRNVVNALVAAKARGLYTVGLTGDADGKMAPFCDTQIRVPASSTPLVQEYHLPLYHALCAMLEAEFFSDV